MKNIVYAKAKLHKNCNLIHIFSKNEELNIDIQMTMPVNLADENKIVFLSALTVLEPLCRCNRKFNLVFEFDVAKIQNNNEKIDESIKLYTNLKWVKENIEFSQEQINVEENILYFANKNTIEIYSEELGKKYALEVSKTLPFAIYERMRSECDYAWLCSECPMGQSGECEAIIYEEYALLQNKN